MVLTGHDGLKLGHYVAADGDGIDAVFRMGSVSSLAAYLNIEGIAGGVGRSLLESNGASRVFRGHMKPHQHIRLHRLIKFTVQKLPGPSAALLRRLE